MFCNLIQFSVLDYSYQRATSRARSTILTLFIASPKGEAISECAQGWLDAEPFSRTSMCVSVSVNNAVRCTLHLLNAI